MIDLIESFHKIGFIVLARMNIQTDTTNSSPMSNDMIKKNHERAKKINLQIMSNFKKQHKAFQSTSVSQEDRDEDNEKNEDQQKMECSICHLDSENDCFVYPALIYKSHLSSYFNWRFKDAKLVNENNENKSSKQLTLLSDIPESFESFNTVRICLHPIHSKCNKREHFHCPADRCPRNATVPIIEEISNDHFKLTDIVHSQAKKFINRAYYNDLKFAVYSLATQIEILEVRLRSNPDCLDDATIQPTLRCIYLCIYHILRNDSQKFLSSDVENEGDELESYNDEYGQLMQRKRIHLSPLMKYILLSLQNNQSSQIDMRYFLSEKLVIKDLNNDYKMLQFLRCAAIFDHFALCNKIIEKVEFIDWDEILGSSYMCKHYKISCTFNNNEDEEMTLPIFTLIDLPKNFFDLIHPPYSAPILECNEGEGLLCLLTGKTILISSLNSMQKLKITLIKNLKEPFQFS